MIGRRYDAGQMKRLRYILLALSCVFPLMLSGVFVPAVAACHSPAVSSAQTDQCPCCPLPALMNAACAAACQPAMQENQLSAAPSRVVVQVDFAIANTLANGRTLQPPAPPPRTDLPVRA